MKLEEVLARRLAAEIDSELDSLDALLREIVHAPQGEDSYSRRARSSILHDFYNGVERIFVRVARELNGGIPQAEHWHRELVSNMALAIPEVRPALIDPPLAANLLEYLRFRHVFRNVYGTVLEADRLRSLEQKLPATLRAFREQMSAFLHWMLGDGDA